MSASLFGSGLLCLGKFIHINCSKTTKTLYFVLLVSPLCEVTENFIGVPAFARKGASANTLFGSTTPKAVSGKNGSDPIASVNLNRPAQNGPWFPLASVNTMTTEARNIPQVGGV